MNPTKNGLVATALSVMLFGPWQFAAHADKAVLTMKPLHAISFDVGTERAVSYFLSENGHCRLVVTLAGEPDWDNAGAFTAARFEAAIHAGKSTRYNVTEFACAADAQAMKVMHVEQVAASAGQ